MADTSSITVESTASTAYAEGAITITKPSGLAVGDLMILVLNFSTSDTVATPSGWTAVVNSSTTFSVAGTDASVFRKTADSGDVAASNFSFDVDDAAGSLAGCLIRISNFNTTNVVQTGATASDNGVGETTKSYTLAYTPLQIDSVLISVVIQAGNVSTNNISSPSSTGSPTWTEVCDFKTGSENQFWVGYAPYPSTTQITNFSYNVNNGVDGGGIYFFAVRSQVDSDTTPTFVSSNQSVFAPVGSAGASGVAGFAASSQSVFAPTGYADTSLAYTNEAKTSISPSNATKNSISPTNQTKNSASVVNENKSAV